MKMPDQCGRLLSSPSTPSVYSPFFIVQRPVTETVADPGVIHLPAAKSSIDRALRSIDNEHLSPPMTKCLNRDVGCMVVATGTDGKFFPCRPLYRFVR